MAGRRKTLSTGTSEASKPTRVAVVIEASGLVYQDLLAGVTLYAARRSGWLIHVEEGPWEEVPRVTRREVDGVLACVQSARWAEALSASGVPVVYASLDGTGCERDVLRRGECLVAGDDEAIGRGGCDFLIDQGYPRVAFVGVPTARNEASLGARAGGFRRRAAERRTPCFEGVLGSGMESWSTLQRELSDWLASVAKPVGVMAYNDMLARQLLQSCTVRGISVPDCVAVLGVGNDPILCLLSRPTLSSVNHSGRTVAYTAAAVLDRWMSGDVSARRVHRVPPLGVVARLSTHRAQIGDEDLAAAMEFIRKHFSEPIQVGDVAEAVHVSRATLKRKFRAGAGRTVSEEIQRMRIERAKELLVSTGFKLEQVARQAGIGSAGHLNAMFRKAIGMSPKAYREQMSGQLGGSTEDPLDGLSRVDGGALDGAG